MKRLRVRLMRAEDIDDRVALYLDERVQSNLSHAGTLVGREQLRAAHLDWLESDWHERLMYRVSTEGDELVGFTWLTEIDWISQRCELSIMLMPRYRQQLGLLALISMYDYLYETLNMHVVLNQVLSVNEMLLSPQLRRSRAQVISPDHVYTLGELRTSYLWGQCRAEHQAVGSGHAQRGARVRRRIDQGAC